MSGHQQTIVTRQRDALASLIDSKAFVHDA
jgi:hypothetical protein